jgi:hypothetical protein
MKRCPGKAAFSLVEVAFAVGVASFCLITIIALIPAGITANQSSIEQTQATSLLSAIVADLRSAPAPTSAAAAGPFLSPRYQIPLPRAADAATTAPGYSLFLQEDGTLSGTLNANADPTKNPRYRVLINFYPPGTNPALNSKSLAATRARILITWPALSDATVSAAPSKFTGSVETVVELNRNWLDH